MSKPKVFVAGLLGKQAARISQEFSKWFDLRFWKDDSPASLKSGAASCDVGILIGSKSSHNTAEVMRANCERYVSIQGGLTTLRNTLKELHN